MRRASERRCATAACRATRCSSRPSSTQGARRATPSPKPGEACDAWASTRLTCTWSTGRRWPDLGMAGLERARELGRPVRRGLQLQCRELETVIAAGTDSAGRQPGAIQPATIPARAAGGVRRRNVAVEAYSPLGTGRNLSDATVARIAQRAGRTPAQVLLRWCLQHGLPVITKSTRRERIEENAQIFDFTLSGRTWPNSTRWTRPTAPTGRWNISGGKKRSAGSLRVRGPRTVRHNRGNSRLRT